MDVRDLFLAQHAAVHSAAVGGNPASAAERTFGGLTDDQMRVRPREDLNSLAWIMWHIARAEDIMLNPVLTSRAQVLDDAWLKRLNIARRDFGIGMKSDEVTDAHARRSTSGPCASTVTPSASARARSSAPSRTRTGTATSRRRALEKAAAQGAFGPPAW